MDKIIFQVDAFTDVHFGGNPAGVVPDATGLGPIQMQKIAREMNLSETAFVFPLKNDEADFQVRFFTPTQEVDLCGHATIATFFTLVKKGYIEGDRNKKIITQKTRAGNLPVEIYFKDHEIEHILMTQAKPECIFEVQDIHELAQIMGLEAENIGLNGYDLLPQAISTGLPDIILPVKSLEVLKKINPNKHQLAAYSDKHGVIGVHAFTMEAEEENSTLACRNFAPAAGIDEEAATGTSNGALGAYLVNNNIIKFEKDITLICEQGYYMGRPSKIVVQLEGNKENLIVKVGGKAIITLEGVMIYE
ncbi:PhzF family phenazine biosynthesis protein [Marinisporobacter balticus]|uniref:Trans-2,3-dihydro-3-hydroxyanthranilate isomerase n=1 Tax=Marinisporobacter balticus TaxID=2018667 RepID=A0A4R2KYR4_9FIRM|nr:PhzF family phenazine biosynthesis protein [Marinisporobacter balticus]TCO78047.1 trans-2,3-dihydro-3-hydroxyanthranilate isomerase [Marinisporobacter balticus]